MTLVGLRATVIVDEAGDMVTERLTAPLKPLRLAREIVEVADEPCSTLIDAGFVEIEKSPVAEEETVNETLAE